METEELKAIIARHFEFQPHGHGLYYAGDWYKAKHQDSLEFLLDEVTKEYDEEISDLRGQLDDAGKEIEKLELEAEDA